MSQNSAAGEISAFTGGPLRLGARPAAGTPYTWQGHSHIIKFQIRPLSVKIISNSGLDITIFVGLDRRRLSGLAPGRRRGLHRDRPGAAPGPASQGLTLSHGHAGELWSDSPKKPPLRTAGPPPPSQLTQVTKLPESVEGSSACLNPPAPGPGFST
jgi:hypothetical protein